MSGVLHLAAPALPLHKAGPYVAGAYVVFLALVLVYVAIMAVRQQRNERELAELRREIRDGEHGLAGAQDAGEGERELEPARR